MSNHPLQHRPGFKRRRGAITLEMAVAAPLVFTMIMGMVIGAIGVFHFQQVATLAREGARYASVRGPDYQSRMKVSAPTADEVFQKAMLPLCASLDQDQLEYTVTWDADQTVVTVKITYSWVPPAFWSPIKLRSTSVMLVSS